MIPAGGRKNLTLELQADTRWIPVVQGVIESGAPILGLDPGKTLRLSMSVEELVAYLARTAPDTRIAMAIARKASHVSAEFAFEADTSDLWAMNITSAGEITPDQGMDQMGLLLASRMSDRFHISLDRQRVVISLEQAIVYPCITPAPAGDISLRGAVSVVTDPEPDQVAMACSLTLALYPEHQRPGFFLTPGSMVDRMADGLLQTAILVDGIGTVAGMICWEQTSEQSIGFYGPYLFSTGDSAVGNAGMLTGSMISSVARTAAMIVYSIKASQDLPPGDFEQLAAFPISGSGRIPEERVLWFRHLREDMGRNVWAHPELAPFLRETYERLYLMRTINETKEQGQQRPDRSVFAAELHAARKEAFLRPMLDGSDVPANIQRHVRMLLSEGFTTLFFSLDLASGWQAAMGGALLANGFTPAFVLPFAGDSDKVVLHYVDPEA